MARFKKSQDDLYIADISYKKSISYYIIFFLQFITIVMYLEKIMMEQFGGVIGQMENY